MEDYHVRLNRRLGSRVRPREITSKSSFYQQYYPNSTLPLPGGVLQFVIPAQTGKFVDLKSSFMVVNAKISGASKIDSAFLVPMETLKTGFGDLLWSTVQAQIGTTVLTDITQTFNFIPSFLRRSLTHPSGWEGPNAINLISSYQQTGSFPPGSPSPLPGIAQQFGLPGGAGDSMGYNLCNTQVQTVFSDVTGVQVDCENQMNVVMSPSALARSTRIFDTVQNANPAGPAPPIVPPTSRPFSFMSWPLGAYNTMDMLLPDNIPVTLLFTRSADNLVIGSWNDNSTAKLDITSVVLWVRYVEPNAEAYREFDSALIERPMSVPYTRSNASLVNIPANSTGINAAGLCSGPKPDIVIVSFHVATAISGDYFNSPFAMRPASTQKGMVYIPQVAQLYITWGGMTYPLIPFTPDGDSLDAAGVQLNQNDVRAYFNYTALAHHGISESSSPLLSMTQFTQNYGFYCIDLRAAASYESGAIGEVRHSDESEQGQLQITGSFTVAPKIAIQACVTAIGGGQLLVDRSRNVIRSGF